MTKADLERLRVELKEEISELKDDQRVFIGVAGGILTAVMLVLRFAPLGGG